MQVDLRSEELIDVLTKTVMFGLGKWEKYFKTSFWVRVACIFKNPMVLYFFFFCSVDCHV